MVVNDTILSSYVAFQSIFLNKDEECGMRFVNHEAPQSKAVVYS